MRKKPTAAVIGAGQVGSTLSFLILLKKLANVVLVDVAEGLAEGKALDIAQAGVLLGFETEIKGTDDFSMIGGCSIAVITAGLPRKPGMDRLDLLKKNSDIVSSVSRKIRQYSPGAIIIVVTNPLDVMTYLAYKSSGFPPSRVMGQAGVLDTARLKYFLSSKLGVSHQALSTFVLGGHGDTMVPLISHTCANGKPVDKILNREEIETLVRETREGGAQIVSLLKTGSAYYAPAASVLEMAQGIINDSGIILPVSAYLNGEYGLRDIYIGVPASIGKDGVRKVIETEITEDEKKLLHDSAALYRKTISEI